MKLTIVLIFACIQISAGGLAQTISLSEKKALLEDVFVEINRQTGYEFIYEAQLIAHAYPVDISVKDATLEHVLSICFAGQPLTYSVFGHTVVIKELERSSGPEKTPALQKGAVEVQLTGRVISKTDGEGLPGVTVSVKGSNIGTVTDAAGRFSLSNVPDDAVLVFSFVGMVTREIPVSGQTSWEIVLEEDVRGLDEVVIVGYGTQKKPNVTGAVAVLEAEDLRSRPITSVTQGLQGLLPGVTVVNPTGEPGSSAASIRIRGIGTIGNANPLVLVDGVEGDIYHINPDDIESISVLKDAASASIYGARAANGVILVTTKQLSGKEQPPTITFSGYYGIQTPTRLPEMADAIDFMTWDNEARRNVLQPEAWTQEHFDKIRTGSDLNHFANTNWVGAAFRDYAPQQNYNISVTGKTALTGYLLSYGLLNQEGLTDNNATNEQRHNFRLKLNTKIADFLTVTSNFNYMMRENQSPLGSPLYNVMRIAPNAPIRYTDGTWAFGGGNTNPIARLNDGGQRSVTAETLSAIFTGKIDLMKGWNVTTTYNFTRDNALHETLSKTLRFVDPETGQENIKDSPNSLSNTDVRALQQSLIVQSNFDIHLAENHTLSGVGGFSQEWYVARNFSASRINLLTEKDPTLNLGDQEGMSNDASASQWAIRSGFGRLNYNFLDRYLLEANLRYDLTSKFAKDSRAGMFPSFSAGWRLAEEPFMDFSREIFDEIKFRGSWGVLGNQYVGSNNYPYLAVIGSVTTPNIGMQPAVGYTQTTLPNPNLTWETIYMTNVGVDINAFRTRLNVSFDYFVKDTEGILLRLTYPDQLGLRPTEENVGSVNNTGWELALSWQDQIRNEIRYGFNFNLSDVKNKITDLGGLAPSFGDYSIRRVGDPINAFYGYEAIGLMTPEDFKYDEVADQYWNPQVPVIIGNDYQPGDIKYRDISGPSGKPDGRITPEHDRKVIGNPIPRYTYMLRADVAWKNFDFAATFQGVGKANGYLQGSARQAFQDMAGYPQKIHGQRYNVDTNPNPNAPYPRFTYNTDYNYRFSTFWMEEASYLRLKNIQLGYSLPSAVLTRLNVSRFRVYWSADNLFTATDFFYAYDPETPVTNGGYYPQVKTFVLGVNITLQ